MDYEKIDEGGLYDAQKAFVLKSISLVSFLVTLVFGINDLYWHDDKRLVSILFMTMFISFLVFYTTSKNSLSLQYRIHMMMFPLFFLMLYLSISGGIEKTGVLWIFVLPPVTLFLYGFRQGLAILTFYLFLVTLLYFAPVGSHVEIPYSFTFKIRLLIVFAISSALTAVYAYVTTLLLGKLHDTTQKLEHIAETDQLTKVLNRHGALYRIKACKEAKRPFSMLLIDVDHFKAINDKHGHLVGDEVLRNIATLIGSHLRKEDSIARWGGKSFWYYYPTQTKKRRSP